MFSYIWPMALVVLSNVFYNITTKSTPEGTNAFLGLTVTYLTAALISAVFFLISSDKAVPFRQQLGGLNWTSFVLGLCIIGLECGYIFMFRAGWKINTASLVANIILACVLIFVGWLLFKESISPKKLVGIAVCLAGLVLIGK